MKTILIKEVKYKDQKYDTVGNYIAFKNHYLIEVSKLRGYIKDEDELMGVALHEFIELMLCLKRGIKIKDIDAWDLAYKGKGEPGELKGAPYFKEHAFANKLEKAFVKELKKICITKMRKKMMMKKIQIHRKKSNFDFMGIL